MAKDPSVAPKERVNIVYRPSVGDAREEVELPLKMLVVGDFTGSPDERPLDRREPVNIDKDNFNDVMKSQEIELVFSVPNRLAAAGSKDAPGQLNINLNIQSMKDLSPEEIVDQVPELRRMIRLREDLKSLTGPLSNIPEFRRKIQQLIQDENARERLFAELGIAGQGEEES